jgi:hypothetical protein
MMDRKPTPIEIQDHSAPLLDTEVQANDHESSHRTSTTMEGESARSSQQGRTDEREPEDLLSRIAVRVPCRQSAIRKKLAILMGTIPVYFLALEMTPEHCNFCRTEKDATASYFAAAAACGGIGATLYGYSCRDWFARLIGGAVAALGSFFMMWMLLKSISTNVVVFLFAIVVGILGAMPGLLTYFIVKLMSDECCFYYERDSHHAEDEVVPLFKVTLQHNLNATMEQAMDSEEVPEALL